jgi:uncharacterized membrane protein YbhN (UPF0104 family)
VNGPRRWWASHGVAVRVIVGAVGGCLIVVAAVKLRAEAHTTAGVLTTLRSADRPRLLLAAALEVGVYLLPGIALARICGELRFPTAARIAVAALGLGSLLPASPLTGSGIGYAELRRAGVPAVRAATASTAIVIGLPALSMLALAGPALIASGLAAPLPPGWRGVVLFAGCLAVVLTIALIALLAGAWPRSRAAVLLGSLGGPLRTVVLLGLGAGAWLCDVGCLWLVGKALGIDLPLSCLPMAYIAGAAIMALPVLPSGLGAVEVTVPAVFAVGGVSYNSALLAVLAWRVLSFWLPTAAAAAALASLHRQRPLPPVPVEG